MNRQVVLKATQLTKIQRRAGLHKGTTSWTIETLETHVQRRPPPQPFAAYRTNHHGIKHMAAVPVLVRRPRESTMWILPQTKIEMIIG
jgi:hypothetical protein